MENDSNVSNSLASYDDAMDVVVSVERFHSLCHFSSVYDASLRVM